MFLPDLRSDGRRVPAFAQSSGMRDGLPHSAGARFDSHWPGVLVAPIWPILDKYLACSCLGCLPSLHSNIPQFGPALDLPTRTGLPRPSPRTSLPHPPPSFHCIVTELCTVSVNFFFSSVFNQLFLLVWDKMASHVQLVTARMRSGPC